MFGFFRRVDGNEFPTPETVDILAEVSEYRAGKPLGYSPLLIRGLAGDVEYFGRRDTVSTDKRAGERDALVRLAAHAIARIELLDKESLD